MPELSVIICTHNPRSDYLGRTLDGLKAQSLPRDRWELLLIDNGSQVRLADTCNISWHPLARHVREDDLGLTPARLRGIKESVGELIVFVDDDNALAPDFLEQALAVAKRYPHVSVFGPGVLEPEFEIPPLPELPSLLPVFMLRQVSSARWSNNPKDGACLPWGAGLCVNRAIAREYLQLVERIGARKLLDRQGQQLFSHGDDLFSWTAARSGQGFGIFPELRVVHLISKTRLSRSYALRLITCSRFSHCILHYLLAGDKPTGVSLFRVIHIMLHGIRRGRFSMQCHWASEIGEQRARRFIARTGLRTFNSSH